jgi:hypothetical protein
MNLTIIPIDGAVYVDGYSYSGLDLAAAPTDVHALQWKETKGWVEFKDNDDGTKPQNQIITELPQWALDCVQVWQNYTPPTPEFQNPIPTTIVGNE